MAKTLCKLARSQPDQLDLIASCDGSRELRVVCRKCGRRAANKKLLCKAQKLDSEPVAIES